MSAVQARATVPVPRFVTALNELARSHGLEVSLEVDHYEGEQERRIFATWRGTKAQLLSLGLLVRSYHFPQEAGTLAIPVRDCSRSRPIATGSITVAGDQIVYTIDFGLVPVEISLRGELEVASYVDETAYHGSAEALLAAGVCTRRQIPSPKRSVRMCDPIGEGPEFATRRYPDGSLVHWLQTQDALRRRMRERERERETELAYYEQAAPSSLGLQRYPHLERAAPRERPSYLRLVVDNDRRTPDGA